jgi:DNA polymerase-3 subunit beta
MQYIRAHRDAILKPLQIVAGIVERRQTLPILANVLLRKDGEQVAFLASDVEIQIQTTASLGPGDGTAATTLSIRKLIDILRALPDSAEVSISVASRKATITAGKSRFALQTLEADDFPSFNTHAQFSASFAMPQKQLKHLFQMVHFAMAQQDIRYYLNGLLMVTDGSQVKVVATDGHRLAFCQADLQAEALAQQEVIIPRKTVLELQRLLADSDEPVLIDLASNQARFRFGEVELISKLVEGKFPEYQRVIPSPSKRRAVVRRESFASSLARASILTSEKFKGVRLTISPSILEIQTSNAEQEEAVEEIEIDYEGDKLEIGFNVNYLQDVLANLKVESLQIDFGDASTSAMLTLPGDESFKYVVMPMRI